LEWWSGKKTARKSVDYWALKKAVLKEQQKAE
jgi:hypothetical protein